MLPNNFLNCFSKIYEKILKAPLVEIKNNRFSSFISAYRETYNTQHVLIRITEEWRKNFLVFMDLSKAFDWIPMIS